jgi:hypothetical protein
VGDGWTFGLAEIEYVTRAVATDPVTPLGYGIVTLNVKFEVRPLRSTAGRVRIFWILERLAALPLITTVIGSIAMALTL